MSHCWLCDGYGKRFEYVCEATLERKCTNCDGAGKVPVVGGWRPFEPFKPEPVCVCPYECATTGGCECHCHKAWR